MLKEVLPKLTRVAVLGTSTNPGNVSTLRETELAAAAFKVQLQFLDVLDPKDIETAFRAAAKGALMESLCWGAPSSILIEHRLQTLQ